jgi:hypothetical protein
MNLDWDKATAARKRRWKEATANTERAAPGQYIYIAGEQKTKIDWAIVEGGHILSRQILRKQLRFPEIAVTHPPDTFCAVYGRA